MELSGPSSVYTAISKTEYKKKKEYIMNAKYLIKQN